MHPTWIDVQHASRARRARDHEALHGLREIALQEALLDAPLLRLSPRLPGEAHTRGMAAVGLVETWQEVTCAAESSLRVIYLYSW